MSTSTTVACTNCDARNRIPIAATGTPRCGTCHTNLPWLADATSSEFDQVVASSALPILVDLWAPWCGPCRAVAPALEDLAKQRAGSLRILKVNVDNEPQVSANLGVQGIPTMVLYDGGAEVARQIGALPAHAITAWVDSAI